MNGSIKLDDLSHYRNLKHLSKEEWQFLDIHLFIAANFNRYCSALLKKIGYQYLPSDATECLLGLFCSTAYKPLKSVHEKNLDAEGEKRNQVMLGTLKMISMTRMVDAIVHEFPSYVPLDYVTTSTLHGEEQQLLDQGSAHVAHAHAYTIDEPFSDLSRSLSTPEQIEQQCQQDEHRKSDMIELLRHQLTITQYQTLRYLLCDNMDLHQIAQMSGTSLTNIRIMLQNIRRRLFEMLSPELAGELEHCLLRK